MDGFAKQWTRLDRSWLNALPAIGFLIGMIFTGLLVNHAYQGVKKSRLAEFDHKSLELIEAVENAISDQQHLMLGVRSLFDGSSNVSRLDFKRYLDSIDMSNSFPSVYGMSWYLRVPHDMLKDFEQIVQNDQSIDSAGFPDFHVFPEITATDHHVITYLYPDIKGKSLIGFDIGSNHERLLTLEKARDTGTFATTPPVQMLAGEVADQGFLLMLPVYSISNPKNLQQRRQSYIGMLSGAIETAVLIPSSWQEGFASVAIRDVTDLIVDPNTRQDMESIIEPFYRNGVHSDAATMLYKSRRIAGREWEFEISMHPAALRHLEDSTLCWFIGVLGSFFSILVFLGADKLSSARKRAHKRAESLAAELLRANNELQRSNGDLSQFAYIASHDLQTPVRNVENSVTLLEDALTNRMDPQVRKYLDYLRESSDRMRKLVEDLLEFSRVDRETLQLVDLDLNDIVSNVENKLALSIKEADATIISEQLPVVQGDQDQLERLFINLLTNAIKYHDESRPPHISIVACLIGADWEVRISDNGIGIDQRFFEKVFEPFQRLHTHDDIGGTGLGLGICKQIVGCHDGDIYIESSSSEGSTIVLRLPACEDILQQAA